MSYSQFQMKHETTSVVLGPLEIRKWDVCKDWLPPVALSGARNGYVWMSLGRREVLKAPECAREPELRWLMLVFLPRTLWTRQISARVTTEPGSAGGTEALGGAGEGGFVFAGIN